MFASVTIYQHSHIFFIMIRGTEEIVQYHDHLMSLSRVGLLVLTVCISTYFWFAYSFFIHQIGTFLDNIRSVLGSGATRITTVDEIFFWVCYIFHSVLCSITPAVGLQLIDGGLRLTRNPGGAKYSGCLSPSFIFYLTYISFAICLGAGLYSFSVAASSGSKAEIAFGIQFVRAEKSSPLSLVGVFTYSVLVVVAAAVLCYRHGFGVWGWFLVAQLMALIGQSLQNSFGDVYEVYSSNFWEQVTIMASIAADGLLNCGSESWIERYRCSIPQERKYEQEGSLLQSAYF